MVTTSTSPCDARFDAYLGALGEHLAGVHAVFRPEWTCRPERFLARRLDAEGIHGEMYVVGGAAIALAFGDAGARPGNRSRRARGGRGCLRGSSGCRRFFVEEIFNA
jgi:hypothetical protein